MKKCIVLFASANKNGHTKQLLDCFLSEYNGELHIYNMYEKNILPCIGCGSCDDKLECYMHDIDELVADIFSSDYIIFASPVYNYTFPAPMKAFLDRLQPFFCKEKSASHRKGFLLASCGKSGKFSIDVMSKQSKIAFSELSSEFSGVYFFTDTDKISTLQENEICKVKELANDFFRTAF